MKNPAIGITAILLLLGGGLYVGWQYRNTGANPRAGLPQDLPDGNLSFSGPAARSRLEASLRLTLPPVAEHIYQFEEEIEKVKFVYAQFDLPDSYVRPVFESHAALLPAPDDLKSDPDLFEALRAMADPRARPWWDPGQLRDRKCAQKSGQRRTGPAPREWTVKVCAGPVGTETTRVYLVFSEGPALKGI